MNEAQKLDPFHEGERLAQERAGETHMADRNGALISDTIVVGARSFLAQQRLIAVALETGGALWASVLAGEAGLVQSDDGREVVFDFKRIARAANDPFWTHVRAGADLGVLAIDFATRRRLRINLRIAAVTHDELRGVVREAYPNCPKYIQRRRLIFGERVSALDAERRGGQELDDNACEAIARADTMFVASRHHERGADASHRGGFPGFVRVVDRRTLRIPDYAGNGMYNTLGNFLVLPRAGVVVIDFAEAEEEAVHLVQMTGTVSVVFNDADAHDETGGTGRFWELAVDRWASARLPLRCSSELIDYSTFNPGRQNQASAQSMP